MFGNSLGLQIAGFFLIAIPTVVIATKLLVWLVYCFKAAPHRSGLEEMELADKTEDIRQGRAPYATYEEWRRDVLSDRPLDQILGRVPEDFFKRHEEEMKNPKHVGAQGAQATVMDLLAVEAAKGPQGAQAQAFARLRLEEIQARIMTEKHDKARQRLEEIRRGVMGLRGEFAGSVGQQGPSGLTGSAGQPGIDNHWDPRYCQRCHGTGTISIMSIPAGKCPACRK